MKLFLSLFCTIILAASCNESRETDANSYSAAEIKKETQRAWNAYKKYAWGYDVLLPLSKKGLIGTKSLWAYRR